MGFKEEYMNFIKKFFNKSVSNNKLISLSEANSMLKRANELANIANKTTDRNEFYNSLNEIKNILRELSKYEGKLPFIGSPSSDLRNLEREEKSQIELLEQRIAEKEKELLQKKIEETEKETGKQIDFNNDFVQYQENINYKAKNKELDMLDEYIIEAGRCLIEKNMASIGVIQRVFKIGFNRAARIMDKLEEMGVVGEEEGTKPRKILMSMEQFEQLLEEMIDEEPQHINSKESNDFEKNPMDAKNILKENFDIDADYSNDGESLKDLKNILVPSALNDSQIEIINLLLKYNSPKTMKLILIDNSIINYSTYNGIPQLLIPVVTKENKIDTTVNWLFSEMESRISKFVEYRVKNIDSFNEKMNEIGESTYPRILCITNEAKEFFSNASKPLERLFMNSNTVGIHFIFFSRFSLKGLSIGIIGELLEISTIDKLRALLSKTRNQNNKQYISKKFDSMEGHQFEYFCADILKNNGFVNVEVTQGSGDHGIDILAEKDDIKYAIQCKCYSSDINNSAVQQAYTGKGFYKRDIAVVLTNRYFTPQAIEEAKELRVKLWDRDKLNEMINNQT